MVETKMGGEGMPPKSTEKEVMDKSKVRLLVVDGEPGCMSVREALKREGYTVEVTNNTLAALEALRNRTYHVLVTAENAEAARCEIQAGMTVAECEELLIRETLIHGTANREQAARLLGISRRALQYKLKSYGLLAPNRIAAVAEPVPETSLHAAGH
jgi:DNA-binding NtrC family response regulator